MHWSEFVLQDVSSDLFALLGTRLDIEAIMDSAEDSRVGYIIGDVSEGAVIQSDSRDGGGAYSDVKILFSKYVLEYGQGSPCRARVIRWITGIRWSGDEGQPRRIGKGPRVIIRVARANCRHGAPEIVVEFRLHA